MANQRYENVFILTPVLSEEQNKETVEKYKKLLKDKNCKIHHEENWGLKKLSYPIQKKTTGFYHLLEFEGDADGLIDKIESEMKRDERVLRFLTVKMDKHHIEFAESRRKKGKKSKKQEEEVSQENETS
jgi:small subunit ribosomal protein S6